MSAVNADAAVTARIFTSSPMWNITQPDASTAPEREQDREDREAGKLQPNGREQAKKGRECEPDRRALRERR